MKKSFIIKTIIITTIFGSGLCYSKGKKYDHTVAFGDSKTERMVQISGNGDLNITGYNGDKVLISSDKRIFKDDEVNEKAKGLRKIGGGGFNIIKNKEDNIIIISRPIDDEVDLDVKVPNNIVLKLGTNGNRQSWGKGHNVGQILSSIFNGNKKGDNNFVTHIVGSTLGGVMHGIIEGDVNIDNFSGIVEVTTVDGDINAENMEGEVTVSTVDGDIHVTFNKINEGRTLYFSTIDGDIDITLPKDTKADIFTRTMEGDVYSGFDGDIITGREIDVDPEAKELHNNFSNIFQLNNVTTRINGGGQELFLNTVDGNIYIRKGN